MKTIITGMGRSGTKWLAKYLCAKHESIDNEKLFYEARSGKKEDHLEVLKQNIDSLPDGDISVNSFLRLHIKELKKLDVQVIGLIRHPQEVISSMMNKGVLEEGDHRPYVINDVEEWNSYSRLEKMCWLWNDILKRLKDCDDIFNFNKLISSDDSEVKELCSFLNIEFDKQRWERMRKKKINSTSFFEKKYVWDDESINVLLKMCGSSMKEHGFEIIKGVKKKHALNIGCGEDYRYPNEEYEWINLDNDRDVEADIHTDFIYDIEEFTHKFYYIEANDVLEHIPIVWENKYEWIKVLKLWCGYLAIDGVIKIQTTDLYSLIDLLMKGEIDEVEYNRRVFDERTSSGDIHYQVFSIGRLRRILIDIGLRVERYSSINGNLIMEARRIK